MMKNLSLDLNFCAIYIGFWDSVFKAVYWPERKYNLILLLVGLGRLVP